MTDESPSPHDAPEGGAAVSGCKHVARKSPAKRRLEKSAKRTVLKSARKSVRQTDAASTTQRTSAPTKRKAATSDAAKLVERVSRAIDVELTQIEAIVSGKRVTPSRRTEAERRLRTLASLARTLTEMTRLRAASPQAKARDDDDALPRDLDEFRATLQARLERMVAAEQNAADGGDDAG